MAAGSENAAIVDRRNTLGFSAAGRCRERSYPAFLQPVLPGKIPFRGPEEGRGGCPDPEDPAEEKGEGCSFGFTLVTETRAGELVLKRVSHSFNSSI